jgi:anhydro-N-acetylmuramic acid kinase
VIAIGLMSGTSLDGIDAALVRIRPKRRSYALDLFNFYTVPFDEPLQRMLQAAVAPPGPSVAQLAQLHRDLGAAFARAAELVVSDTPIDYVASHGQTIWHAGDRSLTMQIGDPFVIREALQATVISDFRSADCAAGGHGAPLVPYFDALILGDDEEDRVAVNIGGMANVTFLPRGADPYAVTAFDTGPGNVLIDAFVQARTSGEMQFDRDGDLAARGRVEDALLEAMLGDPFFALSPPKTTGRDRFGRPFLDAYAERLHRLTLEDAAATLTALTAHSIADGIRHWSPARSRVLVSGGGARNRTLMRLLQERLDSMSVERIDTMHICGDAKEAIAFAVLGYETLRGRASNSPRATGARHAVPLGSIAPFDLYSLLAKVDSECRR